MPPSGFSQKAINGLLEFVKASYESALLQYKTNGKEKESEFLVGKTIELKQRVKKAVKENTSLEINDAGTQGIVTFVVSCYEDLVEEIQDGKDKYNRPVIEGQAMQKEISQIGSYLKEFKL